MKDALGNELHQGDLVAVQLQHLLVYGRVEEIQEGGLISGVNHRGDAQIKLGRVIVHSKHVIEVDPRMLVASVLALRDDTVPRPVELDDPSPSPLTN